MAKTTSKQNYVKKALTGAVVLWLVYIVLSWFAPVNPTAQAHYHLTATQLRALGLSVSIPLGAIWLVAIIGSAKMLQYSQAIRKNREGRGFSFLSYGLIVLIGQLIISSFVSLIGTYKPSLTQTVAMVNVYEAAGFALIGFGLIAFGTEKLVRFVGVAKQARAMMGVAFILLAIIGWLYIGFIVANKYRTFTDNSSIRPTYGVNDALIFLTIVPLYLIAWYTGLVAALNVILFRTKVEGIIYRQFFDDFAVGLSLIIGMSILLQLLTQFSAYLNGLSLNSILAVVFMLLILIAAGYIFVARGASKLFKIETV